MKILKAGKRKETAEVTCHTCHSVLEITQEDVDAKRDPQLQKASDYLVEKLNLNQVTANSAE